jgi:hypothetical protein
MEVTNEARFAETPPARIVPVLADQDVYIGTPPRLDRQRGLRDIGEHEQLAPTV